MSSSPSPGFFGKLSILGDFVSRRVNRSFIDVWDDWLQTGLQASQATLGPEWLELYLNSPIWRFGLSPGICGPQGWAGILMPSVDKVGRYFPLTIAAPLADHHQVFTLFEEHGEWFDHLEDLAFTALEASLDLDEFDGRLKQLTLPLNSITATAADALSWPADMGYASRFCFSLPLNEDGSITPLLAAAGKRMIGTSLPRFSLWTTHGSGLVEPQIHIAQDLPSPDGFTALLTGHLGYAEAPTGGNTGTLDAHSATAPSGEFFDGWQHEPDAVVTVAPALSPAVVSWQWQSHGLSVAGHRRKLNEDSFLERADIGLWMVADGMGGHSAGDVASQRLASALSSNAISDSTALADKLSAVIHIVAQVNTDLCEYSDRYHQGDIVGSTVVMLLAQGQDCVVLWAGDSRLYRYRDGQLQQITRDHSLLESLSRGDSPETANSAVSQNIITRAVGADDELNLDQLHLKAEPGDLYLLCSDGLDKELSAEEIAAQLASGSLADMAQNLIDAALNNQGRDNITLLIVRCATEQTHHQPRRTSSGPGPGLITDR